MVTSAIGRESHPVLLIAVNSLVLVNPSTLNHADMAGMDKF